MENLYNVTTNATDLVGFMQHIQAQVPFAQLTLVAIFTISFTFFLNYGYKQSFVTASFFTVIMSLIFYVMQLLNVAYVTGSVVILGIAVISAYLSKDSQ